MARPVHGHQPPIHPGRHNAVVDALDHQGKEPLAAAHLLLGQPQRLLHLLKRG